jgi:hypothetical protein
VSPGKGPKTVTVFWIVCLLAGGIGVLVGASLVITGIKSARWPKTRGCIISSEVIDCYSNNHSRTIYTPRVTYTYSVNGREYRSHQVSAGDVGSSDKTQAEAVVRKYVPNMEVEVFYDPHGPDRAMLEPGFRIASLLILVVGGTFAVASILGLLGIIGQR